MNFLKRSNNDGKSIALKAGMWYVISTIVVRGIDVITTPIFTRIMSTEAYGTVSNFSSWYSLLLPICSLNLSYSIGRAKLDYDNCFDEYIGSMQLLSFLVTAIFCVIAIVFLNPIANFLELSENAVFLLMMYLLAVPAITYKQNGYRYRYQYKQNIAIAWFLGLATVFFSLIFISFINYDKAVTRMLGIVLPYGVLSLCFWVGSLVKRQVKINIEHWKYGFALSVPLIFHTVSLYILSQSDRVFITKICGASYTALYSLVYNIYPHEGDFRWLASLVSRQLSCGRIRVN